MNKESQQQLEDLIQEAQQIHIQQNKTIFKAIFLSLIQKQL